MTPMGEADERHLQDVKDWICNLIDKKYRRGKEEHGGQLWRKPFIFEMLLEEITDLVVYAHVLRVQKDEPELVNPDLVEPEKH